MKNMLLFLSLTLSLPLHGNDTENLVDSVVIVNAVSVVKDGTVFTTTGTGFFINNDTIITSNHVVSGSSQISIVNEKSQYGNGVVIGRDIISDLALIKSDLRGTPVKLLLGGSTKRGDEILIIGHPRNFQFTFSSGIIAHTNRKGTNPITGIPYIQTDAVINVGNSGSPVFNKTGEVIGMVQAIVTATGGHEGISLIYPSLNILQSIEKINKSSDKIARYNYIGLHTDCIMPTGPKSNYGTRVSEVMPNSPAYHAGLKKGDIIVMMNMSVVTCENNVMSIANSVKPGNSIVGVYTRDNKHVNFNLIVEEVSLPYEK